MARFSLVGSQDFFTKLAESEEEEKAHQQAEKARELAYNNVINSGGDISKAAIAGQEAHDAAYAARMSVIIDETVGGQLILA